MRTSSLTLFFLASLTACERDHASPPVTQSKPVAQQAKNEAPASLPQNIRGEIDALILSRTSSGQLSDDALAKLELLAPRLLELGALIDVLNAVPPEQLPRFTNLVFESVRRLGPKAGQTFNPKYEDAIRLAERLDPKQLAPLVFEDLVTVPPYEFPTSALPEGWGDAELGVHAWKGVQGLIATIIVRYGDNELMERYRNQLKTASPQLQRVMAWGLSRSPDIQDFEILWKLHSQTNNPALAETAKRAMNVIPQTMEALANGSDMRQVNRSRMPPDALRSKAKALRERLQLAKLDTQLTVWD